MKATEKHNLPSCSGIYGIVCPEQNSIVYVGQSKNIRRRAHAHITSKTFKSRKDHWINQLTKKGLEPKFCVLELCESENLEDRKVFWTNHFGLENLLNHCVGTPNIVSNSGREPWPRKSPIGFLVFRVKTLIPKSDKTTRKNLDDAVKKIKREGRWYTANLALLDRNEMVRNEFISTIDYDIFQERINEELYLKVN